MRYTFKRVARDNGPYGETSQYAILDNGREVLSGRDAELVADVYGYLCNKEARS